MLYQPVLTLATLASLYLAHHQESLIPHEGDALGVKSPDALVPKSQIDETQLSAIHAAKEEHLSEPCPSKEASGLETEPKYGYSSEGLSSTEETPAPYAGLQYDYSGSKVMGCYRMVPTYKAFFKTIDSTEQREKTIQVPSKTTRLVTKYRKVPKTTYVDEAYTDVVHDTIMKDKVIMINVPVKKTVQYKVKEYVKQYLPHFNIRGESTGICPFHKGSEPCPVHKDSEPCPEHGAGLLGIEGQKAEQASPEKFEGQKEGHGGEGQEEGHGGEGLQGESSAGEGSEEEHQN